MSFYSPSATRLSINVPRTRDKGRDMFARASTREHTRNCVIAISPNHKHCAASRAPRVPAVHTVLKLTVATPSRCARALCRVSASVPPLAPRPPSSRDQQLFREASEPPIAIWVMGTAQNSPLSRRDRVARRKCVGRNAISTVRRSIRDAASPRRTCCNLQYEILYARRLFVAYLSMRLTGRYPEKATRGLADGSRSSIYSGFVREHESRCRTRRLVRVVSHRDSSLKAVTDKWRNDRILFSPSLPPPRSATTARVAPKVLAQR